jgi:hypothetical protein
MRNSFNILQPIRCQEIKRKLKAGGRVVVKREAMTSVGLDINSDVCGMREHVLQHCHISHTLAVSTTDTEVKFCQHVLQRCSECLCIGADRREKRCQLPDGRGRLDTISIVE